MNDTKDYLWLVKTNKGDFLISVVGKWTEEEATKNVQLVFKRLQLDITAMIRRKYATGSPDAMGTIHQLEKPKRYKYENKIALGFEFLAGKTLWKACGRGAEFEAELIRSKKQMEES